MKCPRTFKTTDDNYGNLYINGAYCLGKECALWDEDLECCGEVSLRTTFKWIGESLELIKDALQRLGQTVSIK